MPYVTNPAGIGVGKRYGPRRVGGLTGVHRGDGINREIVIELKAGELANNAFPFTKVLQENYLVDAIYVEVEEAFATGSTVNLSIEGGDPLTTAISLATAVPVTSVALTGLENTSATAEALLRAVFSAQALASGTGKARVLVNYKVM